MSHKQKTTIYDQENPQNYIHPNLDRTDHVANLSNLDLLSHSPSVEAHEDEGSVRVFDWEGLSPKAKVALVTGGGLLLATVMASSNKATVGEELTSIFHQAERIVGININHSPSKNSLRNFTGKSGQRINVTSA